MNLIYVFLLVMITYILHNSNEMDETIWKKKIPTKLFCFWGFWIIYFYVRRQQVIQAIMIMTMMTIMIGVQNIDQERRVDDVG